MPGAQHRALEAEHVFAQQPPRLDRVLHAALRDQLQATLELEDEVVALAREDHAGQLGPVDEQHGLARASTDHVDGDLIAARRCAIGLEQVAQ